MRNDLFSVLQQKSASFSKGQRLLANFITESYDKAAFMTASKLGKTVGVSESTVVRFAVELGYEGYPHMQKAMQDMVLNRLTSVQRMEVANDRIGNQDVLTAVLQSDADKLRQTAELVDREAFACAVNAILNAKHIFVLGCRSVAPLASFLGYYLSFMFPNVHIVTASGASEMFEKLIDVQAEDVVLAFSFPRYSAATAKGAQYCRTTGATVIGFTDSQLSPLGQNSDYVLLAKSDMLSLVDSLVAPLSLINALIVALAAGRGQVLAKSFEALERVWEEYNVYEKRVDGQ
ncbi:MAG: MurR/RpiR family transcriptional regulator [Oscillospiraceae bacterium]|nr:MurR/RpiR family transcriptional regulator [Oscillospiraceae bacterium]